MSIAPRETVIYHANCDDGFCAAWLHNRHDRREREWETQYVAANYSDDPPDIGGHDVVIYDFSYPRDMLLTLHEMANSLLVFDHHKTARDALEGLDFCTFDMDKSGARLAKEHLDPDGGDNWLVDYVEDRDMWWKKLPGNRRITAGLRSYPREFEAWDAVYERGPDKLADEGEHILRYQQRLIEAATFAEAEGEQ